MENLSSAKGAMTVIYDDYLEDEWHDCEDCWPELVDMGSVLGKAKNGQLYLYDWELGRYPGEDVGQSSHWHETNVRLKDLKIRAHNWLVKLGKGLERGETMDVYWSQLRYLERWRAGKHWTIRRWRRATMTDIPF